MIAEVIVDIALSETDKIFDYIMPDDVKVGERVLVPFGKNTLEGFVIGVKDKTDYPDKIKEIIKPLDDFVAVTPEMIALMRNFSKSLNLRYIDLLRLFLPAGLRGGVIKPVHVEYAKLSGDADTFLDTISSRAKQQRACVEYLKENSDVKKAYLTKTFGNSAVNSLINCGYIEVYSVEKLRTPEVLSTSKKSRPTLNPDQQKAVDEITKGTGTFLLHGVTGSGKTEVYMHCIEDALSKNKTAIMLVPEISLTPQVFLQFKERFGDKVAILHSGLSQGERFDEWRRLRNGEATVAYIGAFTALYAAVVACVQSDIKRVLAFSTISQIGFMLVALGVCTSSDPHTGGLGYMASMFHLFTHAMFKALLFLCAGCIIHAVHSNEMSAMGGMRKYMPVTHITFLVACLAIAGIWPLSGFFSKDEILTACFAFSPLMGWVMTGIAGLTAFYMFRLYYGIFWGKENKELHAHHTPHEAPATMTVPLVVLAVITCVAGFIPFGDFISSDGEAYTIHLDGGVVAISLTVAIAAIALATWMYLRAKQPVADRLATTFSGLHKAAYHRFYIDEAYQFVTHRIIFGCISRPIAWFDRHVVDGFMNLLARTTQSAALGIRFMQSGSVQRYCIWFFAGTLGLTLLLLILR